MMSRQFDRVLSPTVRRALENLTTSPGTHERVAVFDADGTLWKNDASEALLDWVDERGLISPPSGSPSLLAHNDLLCARDRAVGYAWAAQVMAGQRRTDVVGWAATCFEERVRSRVLDESCALVRHLQDAGWEVWIVSASPIWVILPGARLFGIPEERILAIEVDVVDGVLTDRIHPPVTSGLGKVERIQRDLGRTPAVVAGNSIDDVPMLRLASACGVVINPGTLHGKSTDLVGMADSYGWHIIRTLEK